MYLTIKQEIQHCKFLIFLFIFSVIKKQNKTKFDNANDSGNMLCCASLRGFEKTLMRPVQLGMQ